MCSRCMLMRTPSVIARLYETELLRDGVVTALCVGVVHYPWQGE